MSEPVKLNRQDGEPVIYFCNEDLEMQGINPLEVSDEQFERIFDELQEYFAVDSFSHALGEAIQSVLGDVARTDDSSKTTN